ncbi:MAG: nucleoside monophosphate kinase, partial [Patescibacteria group bacterium]
MIIIILGPQGSGKGTQGKKLAEYLKLPFISAGEMLRDEALTGSALGKRIHEIINVQGQLVSPEVITDLFDARLKQDDAKSGVVIDSYPRDLQQYALMKARFVPDIVVVLDLLDAEAVQRLGGRRQCS